MSTTSTTTLRLRAALRTRIVRLAKRHRRSFSDMPQELLEEALRIRDCPRIYFTDEPAGREAKIMGTGLAVWELIQHYQDVDRDERALQKLFPQLSAAHRQRALVYSAKFPAEIDALIAENRRLDLQGAQAGAP